MHVGDSEAELTIDSGLRPGLLFLFLLGFVLSACAPPAPPALPPFEGRESAAWIAYEIDVPGRDPGDLIPAFEASARALGCHTERLESGSNPTIASGILRSFHGVAATCELGTVALITLVGERVRVGCVKPTAREECDALLEKISEAR